MALKEIGWEGVYWINLSQYRGQWLALMNTVINVRIPWGQVYS
jgi:hypothetical protein